MVNTALYCPPLLSASLYKFENSYGTPATPETVSSVVQVTPLNLCILADTAVADVPLSNW